MGLLSRIDPQMMSAFSGAPQFQQQLEQGFPSQQPGFMPMPGSSGGIGRLPSPIPPMGAFNPPAQAATPPRFPRAILGLGLL